MPHQEGGVAGAYPAAQLWILNQPRGFRWRARRSSGMAMPVSTQTPVQAQAHSKQISESFPLRAV